MANYCDYEIRVKGSKNAGQMVFHSMPCMDYKDIEWEKETGGTTTLCFTGNCKWSVNYGVNDNLNPVNVDSMSESEIEDKGMDYWEYSLRAKSEAFQCEIMVHYWSEESEFDQFDHYKNGKLLKQRKLECNYDEQNKFDWDTLEFVGHEGEYDESVDGEQQDAKFFMAANMAAQMAYGGGQDQQEPEMSDEDANNLDDINSQLADLLDEVKDLAAEVGVDINAEQIGDTGFDMYDWTFTNGNRKSGKGWSVAIPDGFVVIDSNEGRVFEAVPQGMEESDPESIPIQILPGVEQQVPRQGDDLWMYHPYAREGTAEVFAVETSKVMMQLMGSAPEIISVAFDDIYAYALIGDTSGGSYTYQCSVFTDGKMQQIRVQTGSILYDQKQILTKSILTWLKSFKFDKPNAAMPKETQLESSKVLSDLKNGKTTSFDAAVKRAQDEYVITVNGRLNTIQYSSEYGILDWDTAPDTVREILSHGMDVKEFYYQKADELIEKLKSSQVKASTMKKVYKKLEDLEDVKTTFALDDEDITVDLPAKVKEIQKKWKNEAAEVTELEKVEAKAEAEAAEAKLKQEMAEWEEKVEKLKSDRNKEEQERTEQIKKSISDQKARLLEVKEEKLANCEKEINTLKHQLAEDQWELERLGFFKSSRKKELTLAIESITAKLKEKEDSLGVIQREYQRDMEAADSSEAAKLKALSKELERKYEIPKSPKEIAMRKWEDENRKANMTEHEYENYKIKEAILDALSRCGSPLTTTDITNSEQVQAFATIEQPISKNKVTALLTQLINEEKVTKTYDRKVAYFRLCNFQYDDQDVVGGNPERTMEVQNEWKPEKTEENRISELSKKESAIPKKKRSRG